MLNHQAIQKLYCALTEFIKNSSSLAIIFSIVLFILSVSFTPLHAKYNERDKYFEKTYNENELVFEFDYYRTYLWFNHSYDVKETISADIWGNDVHIKKQYPNNKKKNYVLNQFNASIANLAGFSLFFNAANTYLDKLQSEEIKRKTGLDRYRFGIEFEFPRDKKTNLDIGIIAIYEYMHKKDDNVIYTLAGASVEKDERLTYHSAEILGHITIAKKNRYMLSAVCGASLIVWDFPFFTIYKNNDNYYLDIVEPRYYLLSPSFGVRGDWIFGFFYCFGQIDGRMSENSFVFGDRKNVDFNLYFLGNFELGVGTILFNHARLYISGFYYYQFLEYSPISNSEDFGIEAIIDSFSEYGFRLGLSIIF